MAVQNIPMAQDMNDIIEILAIISDSMTSCTARALLRLKVADHEWVPEPQRVEAFAEYNHIMQEDIPNLQRQYSQYCDELAELSAWFEP